MGECRKLNNLCTQCYHKKKDQTICNHKWIANSGLGGKPVFTVDRQRSNEPLMHVKCCICKVYNWLNKPRWDKSHE